MIKIDKGNLDTIANKYYSYIKEIAFGSQEKKELYNKFLPDPEKYITFPYTQFKSLKDEFETMFNTFINEYNEIREKDEKRAKAETVYGKFVSYMEGRYKTVLKHEITDEESGEKMPVGYWLSKQLKIDTCPYCNRQYTYTINKGKNKGARPQFDHFLPKSEYPYFALSFYNLIPCCSICNHIKLDEKDKELLHPYYEGFDNHFKFEVNLLENILQDKKIEIGCKEQGQIEDFDFKTRCENNINTFILNELYSLHSDYAEEIIEKAFAYNKDYFDGLIMEFSRIGKSTSEIKRIIFGNYIDRAEHEKRPLSKLTSDILDQIGLKE